MGSIVVPLRELLSEPQLVLDQWMTLDGALPESQILLRAELKVGEDTSTHTHLFLSQLSRRRGTTRFKSLQVLNSRMTDEPSVTGSEEEEMVPTNEQISKAAREEETNSELPSE